MYQHTARAEATARWEEPDVLIVGAGASGAAVAWLLAEAGMKVVCLDQGGWVEPADLPHHQTDWELRRFTDFSPDPNVRQLAADYPVNAEASDFIPLMFNAVGGSTIHWSAHFPRYHPSDFRVRSLDGVSQLAWGVRGDGIALVGAVEGDAGDAVGDLIREGAVLRHAMNCSASPVPLSVARSRIGARSRPAGRVPNTSP